MWLNLNLTPAEGRENRSEGGHVLLFGSNFQFGLLSPDIRMLVRQSLVSDLLLGFTYIRTLSPVVQIRIYLLAFYLRGMLRFRHLNPNCQFSSLDSNIRISYIFFFSFLSCQLGFYQVVSVVVQ